VENNIIAVHPESVAALVGFLRSIIVQKHLHAISAEAKDSKANELYEFVLSGKGIDTLDKIVITTRALDDLEKSEVSQHGRVWSKRATLIRAIQDAHTEFTTAVSAIIAGDPS